MSRAGGGFSSGGGHSSNHSSGGHTVSSGSHCSSHYGGSSSDDYDFDIDFDSAPIDPKVRRRGTIIAVCTIAIVLLAFACIGIYVHSVTS